MSKNKNSRNLADVSSSGGRGHHERRQVSRLSLGSEQFLLSEPHRIFSVTDLSEKGMGLWVSDRDDSGFFSVGRKITGVLNLKRQKYSVEARVRNVNPDRVGCEFENLPSTVIQAITTYLEPALLGVELKPIPSENNTLWYHGPSETDLLLKRSADGHYEQVVLYVLNSFIQWEREQGLSTGRVGMSDERSETRGIFRVETLFLYPDTKPDTDKLSIAKTVIMSSNLPLDLKSWCIRQFER